MKKSIRFIALALAGVVALLLPLKADAVCGSNIQFGGYGVGLVTGTTNGPSLRSNFWIVGGGNPTIGVGADNGSFTESADWLQPYGAGTWFINGDWGSTLYDGCPDAVTAPASQRMAFSFSDVNGTGDMTFATVCVHRDTTAASQFGTDGVGVPIALVPAPKGVITNTVRSGNDAQVTVGAPSFAAGYYTDGSVGCEIATVIPQYDVYQQQVARNVAPNSTRDAGATWVLVGTGNSGSPFTFTTACGATNCDVFVALSPHYNSNFTSGEAATLAPARVGPNSTKVQAGPTLAVTPKAKPIENKKIAE